MKITILALFDRISIYHSLRPFLFEESDHQFTITDSEEYCLMRDSNEILIMVRRFLKPDRIDFPLLEQLRRKYRRLIFFNGNAGGGIHRPEVLPFVDLFYSKSLFRDFGNYLRPLYGGELYSDFYHRTMGIEDREEIIVSGVENPEDLKKLRLFWNTGIGEFPRNKLRQRAGVLTARLLGIAAARGLMRKNRTVTPSNSERYQVHARIGFQQRESVTWQRRLHLEKLESLPGVLTGKVSQRQFNTELVHSRIIYSPFGWGELCFRDFEAVCSGALLIKPDMSHLTTWPDIFIPGETYVPVRWDGEDLLETCRYYLSHDRERKRICESALEQYRAECALLPDRYRTVLAEITGET